MEIGRCKDCKWWERKEDLAHGHGWPASYSEVDCFQICRNPLLNQDGYNQDKGGYSGANLIPDLNKQAGPMNTDGLGADIFYTGPDFGCIHFEVRKLS